MLPDTVIDPFTKRHKLVHNGGFPKFEELCCSQNAVKTLVTRSSFQITKFQVKLKAMTIFGCIRHHGPVCLLLCMTTSKTHLLQLKVPKSADIEAGANERILLKKQNCVQDAKNVFLENFKSIFCFKDANFVSSTYVDCWRKRRIIWERPKKH